MKFSDVVKDYKGLGYGTIFGGDSGYTLMSTMI